MSKTNAVINMKDINGKKVTKSITDISNSATNQQILDFAQGLVGVTNNYYDYTNKVVTTKVDSEPDPQPEKTTPTFYLARATDSLTPVTTIEKDTVDWLIYNGNATAPGVITSNLGLGFGISNFENGHTRTIYAIHSTDFFVPETNNYKSATCEAVYIKS